jgi:hypothetical protein
MYDGLRDAAKKLTHHDGLELFRYTIEGFLDYMASESVHAQCHSIATNRICNALDLLRGSVFETPLNEKVAETVDHQLISLSNNSINNRMFLLCSADFEFLLQKDRCLLIVIADNLVNNILPIAVDATFK